MALSVGELVAYLRLDSSGFDAKISSAQRNLDLTGASATRAGRSIGTTEAALRNSGRAAETASASAGKLRAAQLSVVASQERYNAELAKGTANTARLASAEASLIRAQERLASMKPAAVVQPGGMEKFRSGIMGSVESLAKLGVGLGVFELAMKGIEEFKAGNEFTTELNGVQAASHATDQQMKAVRASAIGLGKDLKVPGATAVDAAGAMNDLVKAGVSLDRAMVAARPALLLASAAQVSTANAARVLGDTLDDFHLKADQAGHVANVLAAAANSAGGGLMDLFDGLKYVGPTARVVGMDVTTTAAGLVELAKSGMQGSLGGTAMSNMLTRLNPTAKSAKAALRDLGVSAYDAKGQFIGFPKVIDELHAAQLRLNPQQFGQAVQVAFGARAKNAVINFATGGSEAFDEFYAKLKAGNVEEYAATMNRGLSAAGAQLRKEITGWAVDINGKVQPALAKIVFAIGNDLPKAIHGASQVLSPLEHEFAAVLVPALHLTADVLGMVGHGIADVGSLLSHHTGTVQVLATEVIGLWAAFKGYGIAKAAVSGIASVLDTVRLKAMYAKDSIGNIASGGQSLASAFSPATLAIGGIGIALGVAAIAWQKHQSAVAADKQAIENYTSAIQQDSGAIGENTRQQAINALQKAGALKDAKTLGVSVKDVTDATLGNSEAMARVNDALRQYQQIGIDGKVYGADATKTTKQQSDAYYELTGAIGGNNKQVNSAVDAAKLKAEADGKSTQVTNEQTAAQQALAASLVYTVDSSGNLVQGQQAVGSSVNDTTEALVAQKTASDLLKSSWDALDGTAETAEQTQNAFLDSLDAVADAVKTNGKSMDQNTSAGRKNREQMVSVIDAAKAQAQAYGDTVAATDGQTAGLQAGNRALAANEKAILAHADKLGLDHAATKRLIDALGQLSEVKPSTTVTVQTKEAAANIAAFKTYLGTIPAGKGVRITTNGVNEAMVQIGNLHRQIIDLPSGKIVTITTNQVTHDSIVKTQGGVTASARASGGTLPEGYSTINEQGWELLEKHGSHVMVHSHADSVKMLPQGPSVPAFAAGTAKAKPVQASIVERAGGGAAYGIADYIRGSIPNVRTAMAELSVAVNDAFQLKGIQAKLAAEKATLSSLISARSQYAQGLVSTLSGSVDVGKYGDVQGMLAAIQGGTANNNKFILDQKKLAAAKVPTALVQALSKDGMSAGLDTLANASASDRASLIRAYSAYGSSAQMGGSLAGNAAYGSQIASTQKMIAANTASAKRYETAINRLVALIGRQTNKPVQVSIDGKVIASAVIRSGEFAGELDAITHELRG